MSILNTVDEQLRLEDLSHYDAMIDQPDEDLCELSKLASVVTESPIAGVSLVDAEFVWLKGRHGVNVDCLAREGAFCAHAVESNEDVFVVNDAATDPRFAKNPLVAHEPNIRYYAAATLVSNRGYRLGTLWTMDLKPKVLSDNTRMALQGLAAQAMRILEMRYIDPLTKLANRPSFIGTLQTHLNRRGPAAAISEFESGVVSMFPTNRPMTRKDSRHCVVGCVQLRNMRIVKSAYGDEVGNALIKGIAARLADWSGESHLIARLEPDGFAFAVFGSPRETAAKIDQLKRAMAVPIRVDKLSLRPIFTVGISTFPDAGLSASSLLDQALAAAHQTEDTEPALVISFKPKTRGDAQLVVEFQSLLPELLAQRKFNAHYQPQVDSVSKKVVGLEALARIYHPELSAIGPSSFIAVAEQIGMIDQVDLLMVDQVCRDLRGWMDQGIAVVPVSVNLSRATLTQPGVTESIVDTLRRYRVPSSLIEIELTESGLVQWPVATQQRIEELHKAGLRVALDDFGTGLSNLATLRTFRIERLKADRAYVHGASSNEHVGGILRFIHNITELFDIELICEGLEDEEDLFWAQTIGCRLFQGWYYCKALSPEATVTMLRDLPKFQLSPDRKRDAAFSAFLQSFHSH